MFFTLHRFIYLFIYVISESPHSEPGALDEVDNGTGPNTSDEGESPTVTL